MTIEALSNNENMTLTVKGYYDINGNIESKYTDGLYASIPDESFHDYLAQKVGVNHYSRNLMEWAYNNPYQNHTEDNRSYLDASGANQVRVIGSMKTIWKEFRHTSPDILSKPISEVEESFWNFYITDHFKDFERGVWIFAKYVSSRRALMTEDEREEEVRKAGIFADETNWSKGCRDYLKHLIYTSPRGYILEERMFYILGRLTGSRFFESNVEDERKGIDGYLCFSDRTKMGISLKPDSYKKKFNYASPLLESCWVTYKRDGSDLIFDVKTGRDILKKKMEQASLG